MVAQGEEREFMQLATGLPCDIGIQFFSVGMAYWGPEAGLYTFDMQPVIRTAVDVEGCLEPGEVLLTGAPLSYVDVELNPGYVYYGEVLFDEPHCLEIGLDYFIGWKVTNFGLSVEMQMGNCWNDACENYAADGTGGWDDIPVDLGYNAQAYI